MLQCADAECIVLAKQLKLHQRCNAIGSVYWELASASGFGRPSIQTAENILYSGREDDVHQSGVAIVMTRYTSRCLESWSSVSDWIITARFHCKYIKTTIV